MAIRGSLRRVLEEVSLDDLISGNLPADVVSLAADYRTTTDRRHPRNPR
jgi:hypothetical protein